jgi:pimeloyl-ACP methyl ester carboxylesterase
MHIRLAAVLGSALVCLGCQHNPPQAQYPPPGKLIDIGGRKLHLNCTGNGSPAVILVAGGGAFSIDWALVQPEVSQKTRVCSYDRAGLAWSDPGPADETVEQTVSDLHVLLQAAGEKGPFVLVGASVAGIYIQAYQRAYPNQVAALVFSNSSNRIGRLVNGQAALIWDMTEDQIRSTFPLPASVKGRAPTSEDDPFNRLPKSLQAVRLSLDLQLWRKWEPTKEKPDSTLSWRKEFLEEFAETNAKEHPLDNLPVVVIASDPAASASQRLSRDEAAPRLDFLSSNTVHITAAGSGHEIHLYQPDVVAKGIMRAVAAVRGGSPLSGSESQIALSPTDPRQVPLGAKLAPWLTDVRAYCSGS